MSVAELAVSHLAWLMDIASGLCRNPEDAKDLTAETILRILNSSARYDPGRDFKPWARTVMAHIWYDEFNRRRRLEMTALEEWCDALACDSYTDAAFIHSLLEQARHKAVGVGTLTLYSQGYSYKEIAEIEGVPIGTVKSRIRDGRKFLRKLLE